MNYRQNKSARQAISNATGEARKELIRTLKELAYRHDLFRVWSDFVEMAAISVANSTDSKRAERREARYMQLVKAYERAELEAFARALACLVQSMEEEHFGDVLGETFMALGLGSKWSGQFFTPYPVCQLMAKMSLDKASIERDGFLDFSDPCVGGGAMPIAAAQALYDEGLNPQQVLHVTCQDIDLRAVHMAFLQLSLLHIPGVVIHGNSLGPAPIVDDCYWFTPAHFLGCWPRKLWARRMLRGICEAERAPAADALVLEEASAREECSESPWPFPLQADLFN